MPDRQTRSGSINSPSAFALSDVKFLITQSEERILSKLDTIVSSISALEKRFDAIQTEQIRLGLEITSVKDVIIKQQKQIETLEAEKRQMNLVFSNIPETNVNIDDVTLDDDLSKLKFLCSEINECFDVDDINSHFRIGPRKTGQKRLLLVKFDDTETRNKILFAQRAIRESEKCKAGFGLVFINKDSTPLIRKEEKRLREKLKTMRSSCEPADKIYIKSGKLYKNSNVVDEVSIANQLF